MAFRIFYPSLSRPGCSKNQGMHPQLQRFECYDSSSGRCIMGRCCLHHCLGPNEGYYHLSSLYMVRFFNIIFASFSFFIFPLSSFCFFSFVFLSGPSVLLFMLFLACLCVYSPWLLCQPQFLLCQPQFALLALGSASVSLIISSRLSQRFRLQVSIHQGPSRMFQPFHCCFQVVLLLFNFFVCFFLLFNFFVCFFNLFFSLPTGTEEALVPCRRNQCAGRHRLVRL